MLAAVRARALGAQSRVCSGREGGRLFEALVTREGQHCASAALDQQGEEAPRTRDALMFWELLAGSPQARVLAMTLSAHRGERERRS
jgi:hypothetical protein